MGEALGVNPPLGLRLDPVIPHGRGGIEALLEVAALEDPPVIGRASPDPGDAIGLQLEAGSDR